ncbi:hypothetical protein [Paractinoplanes hotanensis]|uniref:Uncharacterized protein n=1 Tax=Paractinoplanes hotanensis TaxID=2906497 RepID=A0ABT0Y213_9ACTN|nr:hypothetical protein [Actinoplanes hotanensis]MCM4080056.1 hypothetical protein [Actinoplanes hotanensis]
MVVEVLLREARLIKRSTALVGRPPVQLLWVFQQFEQVHQGLSCRFEPLFLVVVQLPGQPASLVSEVPQSGRDLVSRPVRVADQVEEAIFLRVQLLEAGCHLGPDLLLAFGRIDQPFLNERRDLLAQRRG